jgi:hypothetical protein
MVGLMQNGVEIFVARVNGARDPIVQLQGRAIDATDLRVAGFLAITKDVIAALKRRPTFTRPALASIVQGTSAAIITVGFVLREDTSHRIQAALVRAGIAVHTLKRRPTDANPIFTAVPEGTVLAIFACRDIRRLGASCLRVAAIGGAGITVVAIDRRASHA